jgi:hypothetical protein
MAAKRTSEVEATLPPFLRGWPEMLSEEREHNLNTVVTTGTLCNSSVQHFKYCISNFVVGTDK